MSRAYDYLGAELKQIEDAGIRDFTEQVLSVAPMYFWVVPSSSTGKYHCAQSNGTGGLVRHTRAVVYFAGILCRAYALEGRDKDIIVSACILHDVVKYGLTMQKFTTKIHDKDGANFILNTGKQSVLIDKHTVNDIAQAVGHHMGRWTTHERAKKFPEDYTTRELIVHLADMCSAGKEVNLEFLQENLIG